MEYTEDDIKVLNNQITKLKDLIIEKDFEISSLRDQNSQLQHLAEQYYSLYTKLVNQDEQKESSEK